MTARPEFGDAIAVEGVRPAWLPDDVRVFGFDTIERHWFGLASYHTEQSLPSDEWPNISAIRLEVPRYDFVYLALERGMVPWFGQSETSPSDWDGISALQRCGNVVPCIGSWKHPWGGDPLYDVIGYTRKATTTALPLAHPAAPQGEPIKMLLWCPKCHEQHIDEPDERTPDWTNPPHRSHLCHECGTIWRPADVPTEGVVQIETRGKVDTFPALAEAATMREDVTQAVTNATGQIERICPRCRVNGLHYFKRTVPDAYGANTPRSVLALCGSTPGCEFQWRAILRAEEVA